MKRTTLTPPPLKSLNIAIASAILGLGAVSTVHAQIQSGTIAALEELEKKAQKIAEQAGNGKITDNDAIKKLLGLSIQGNQISIQDLNTRADINKDNIAKNKADTDASFETLTKNQNALIEQQNALIEQDKAITQELEGFIAYTQAQDQKNFLNQFEIEKNKDAISKNNDSIDDLYEANNENVERIVTIDYAVAANRENIQQNNASIEDLYEANNENVERIVEIDNTVFANRLNIQELERKQENDIKDVVGMQNAIAEQADKNRNHIKELANAQLESVTFLGEQIQENKDDIANNINNIYELAQQQDQHSSDIKTLAKASATNKADADAKFKGVQTDIANNKITLANHAKKINDNQQAIEAKLGGKVDLQKLAELKTSVDKNQADIADNINNIHELAQQQDQHGSDIRTLAKAGITNKDAIAKNTQSITTLDNKVNTFDGRISALDAKVNGFDGRINALDDKVENSMAAQAALNGLFQPYNVGKVSVSAAVGAYGSKSAIAVGAGYRVNPHLAFKGGAAINTSGSRKGSYNLGINYEF